MPADEMPSIRGRFPAKFAEIDAADMGANTIVAAVSGKSIRVISMVLIATAAVILTVRSGSDNISGAMSIAVDTGFANTCDSGLLQTAQGEALVFNLSAAEQVSGFLTYIEVD